MSVSLKDLRKLSTDLEKKKREIVEEEKRQQIEKQTQLKEESVKRSAFLKEQAEAQAIKSKRIKRIFVLIGLFVFLLTIAIAFRVMMDGWSGSNHAPTILISDKMTPLDASDPAYKQNLKFVNSMMAVAEKAPDKLTIPFNKALSRDRQLAFKQTLVQAAKKKGWTPASVNQESRSEVVRVVLKSGDASLTIDLSKDKKGIPQVVKIY